MKESELKMMIREELEKIINEENLDEFTGRALRRAAAGIGNAIRGKYQRAVDGAEKAIGKGRTGRAIANSVRGGIAGDNPARKAKELANKQSEQLKQVAAQLQKIVQFLNQMTK